jgi:hypothetical protein
METSWHNERRAELHELKNSNPVELSAIYCHFIGLEEFDLLRRRVSFTTMIETILEAEEQEKQRLTEQIGV